MIDTVLKIEYNIIDILTNIRQRKKQQESGCYHLFGEDINETDEKKTYSDRG